MPSGHTDVKRSGFVAVAGRPNAGKSTLINRLVGEHVAIVSPIAQTTRRVIRAVTHFGDAQAVFVDLPGSQKPVDRLTTRMQAAVEHSLADVDVVLWVVDATDEPYAGERRVADMVFRAGAPVVVALNKVDRVRKPLVLERLAQLDAIIDGREYAALVPVSATQGTGTDALAAELERLLPEGTAYFPADETTDMRVEERISEYIREATLSFLRDELPHATIVEIDELTEGDNGVVVIDAIIWVERESQVGIVVGKGGETIKSIGTNARTVIEEMLDRRCMLHLRVKVRRNWRDDDTQLERWGL